MEENSLSRWINKLFFLHKKMSLNTKTAWTPTYRRRSCRRRISWCCRARASGRGWGCRRATRPGRWRAPAATPSGSSPSRGRWTRSRHARRRSWGSGCGKGRARPSGGRPGREREREEEALGQFLRQEFSLEAEKGGFNFGRINRYILDRAFSPAGFPGMQRKRF